MKNRENSIKLLSKMQKREVYLDIELKHSAGADNPFQVRSIYIKSK